MDPRARIIHLFESASVISYGAIADYLDLDLELVVQICNELETEGLIGPPMI